MKKMKGGFFWRCWPENIYMGIWIYILGKNHVIFIFEVLVKERELQVTKVVSLSIKNVHKIISFLWLKKGSCQLLVKVSAWSTGQLLQRSKPAHVKYDHSDMTMAVYRRRKTLTQQQQ